MAVPPEPPPDVSTRYFPQILATVLLLAGTSGIIDAVAYQRFGVFVANQTGNLVVVAVSFNSTAGALALGLSTVSLACFIVGVFLAMWLRNSLRQRIGANRARQAMLAIEVSLIAMASAAVLVGGEARTAYLAVAVLATCQAVQAVVIMRIVGVAIQTVVINTALVDSATWWFSGRRRAAAVTFATPIGYFAGAATASFLIRFPPPTALSSAILTAGASLLVAERMRGRGAAID